MIKLSSGKKGYSLKLEGDLSFDDLGPLYDEAQKIAERPADTVVHWKGTAWAHFACVQLLLSLRKTVTGAGFKFDLGDAGPALTPVWTELGIPLSA
jgi:hypothetical protein